MENTESPITTIKLLKRYKRDWRVYALSGAVLIFVMYWCAFSAPSNFPTKSIVTLPSGAGLLEISNKLQAEHAVRSALMFRISAILLGGEHGMQAGDYYLNEGQGAFTLAYRMVHGSHGLALVKITIPEGYTVKQISALFDTRFPLFNHVAFEASAPQGYLFPDTYFIQVNATASSTSSLLQSNFHAKVDGLGIDIINSGHSIYNIIDVASVLQAEVRTPEDMALVSGIVWKRLKLDMPLQVDSAPDTYKRKGLPLSPINNPGLVAIKAAIHPTDSPYLYFISDKKGITHYSVTLDEQTANIKKFL